MSFHCLSYRAALARQPDFRLRDRIRVKTKSILVGSQRFL